MGIGQFVTLMRRNLPMVYIIGGQTATGSPRASFADADVGSTLRTLVNDLRRLDTGIMG